MAAKAYLPVPEPPDYEDTHRFPVQSGLLHASGGPTPGGQSGTTATGATPLPQIADTASQARYRTGPGDYDYVDQWMGEDIWVVPRQGVENGLGLFTFNQWQPPNEGHGEYGFAQDGPWIDHSTRNLALFWSDWNAATSLNGGGRGSFTGEHIAIYRIPPGSTQGYMPTYMEQYNTARDMPGPWDQQLLVGREQFIQRQLAATSMPG